MGVFPVQGTVDDHRTGHGVVGAGSVPDSREAHTTDCFTMGLWGFEPNSETDPVTGRSESGFRYDQKPSGPGRPSSGGSC